jgi:hypothetical protein
LACLVWGLCHGSGLAEPDQNLDGYENGWERAVERTGEGTAFAVVFGADKTNDTVRDFSSWRIGNFGAETTLTASANPIPTRYESLFGNGYDARAYAAVFGAGYADDYADFTDWQIGNFGIGTNLVAASSFSSRGYGYNAVFGIGSTEIDWYNLTSSGAQNFSNWRIGNFGDNVRLSSRIIDQHFGTVSSAIFGAGLACDSDFSGWQIGDFSTNAELNIFISPNDAMVGESEPRAGAAIFGAGQAVGGDFSGWQIGNFSSGAKLTSSARACTTLVTIFGAGQTVGGDFSGWTIGNFDSGASLTAYAYDVYVDYDNMCRRAYAAVFGAADDAYGSGALMRNWTVEFRGSATLSAIVFGSCSVNTLGGIANENFRFYFNNAGDRDATVSIAALCLGEVAYPTQWGRGRIVADTGSGQAVLSVGRQGLFSGSYPYADKPCAVNLGSGFQLNIGRARALGETKQVDGTLETVASVASGGQPFGNPGTMNIFGAISKVNYNGSTAGSILRIDSGWTVNAYGPVENLGAIEVNDGVFNTYSTIRNIMLTSGTVNAYGQTDGISIRWYDGIAHYSGIMLNGGNLRIARCENTNFDENFETLQNGIRYIDLDGTAYGYGEDKKLILSEDNYPWRGNYDGGKLILNNVDNLVFNVDSSMADPTIQSARIPGADGVFEFVNGHVIIEDGGSLVFNGGKICLVNAVPDDATILPAHTDVWLIRTESGGEITYNASAYGNAPLEDAPIGGMPEVTRQKLPIGIVRNQEGCAQLHGDLAVYIFSANGEDGNPYGGLYIANPYNVPVITVPSDPAARQANSELANISVATASMLRAAAARPLIRANISGDGIFAAILGEHFRQSEIDGFGYRANLKGIACGVDRSLPLVNSRRSLRLGAMAGYLNGNVHFSGSAAGRGKIVPSKFYSGAIFAAYDGLGENDLKTAVNFFAGLQHSENKLSRVNDDGYTFGGKMSANGQFASLEAVKILRRWAGVQIGPWALLSYDRICQKGYAERGNSSDNAGAQTVSSVSHNFLDTTIGLNAEKDFQPTDTQRYITGAFLKCGWRHRAIQNHSAALVKFNSAALGNEFYPATFGYPGRNSLVIDTGLRANFNIHWNAIANFHGTLAKNQNTCALSLTIRYNF